jgi:hypothetical protein
MNLQSENIQELITALSKAQGEMQPAIKDSENPYFKSKYADLTSVWEACRPALAKHSLAVIQATCVMEGKLMLATTLAHSSGQWMRSYTPILSKDESCQAMGSAITYARRYSLASLVGVCPDEDDDGNAAMPPKNVFNGHPQPRPPAKPKVNPQNIQTLEIMLKADQVDTGLLREYIFDIANQSKGKWDMEGVAKYALKDNNTYADLKGKYLDYAGKQQAAEAVVA